MYWQLRQRTQAPARFSNNRESPNALSGNDWFIRIVQGEDADINKHIEFFI